MSSKQQISTFKNSADKIYELQDYTSATILYFKTWFAIHDFILLEKIGYAPKDHKERFELLKKNFPLEYIFIDEEFNTYRNTYSRIISKDTCDRIKKLVEDAINKNNIN
ncbi:MAG: hypothetical protein AB7V77_04960 [Candidatus Woesearchaeota archaeon]